jgi:AcrR family transcriptional regulator
VSGRVGCARTNAYNYFTDYQDLLWTTFRDTLQTYGRFLVSGLDESLDPQEYPRQIIANLATFPQAHPGLYRFIASDPLPGQIPDDILETVSSMKAWLSDTFAVLSGHKVDPTAARSAAALVLAYVDGETLNLINARQAPGEDVGARIEGNAFRLFELLIKDATGPMWLPYTPCPRTGIRS